MSGWRPMRRLGRVLFLLAAFVMLGTITHPLPVEEPKGPATAPLAVEDLVVDGDDRHRRAGPLRYLGGWALSAPELRFGGVSAIHVGDREVVALTDSGALLRFARPDRPGRRTVRIEPLLEAGDRSGGDTEAMTIEGDQAWVAIEGANAVLRYRLSDWTMTAAAQPRAMARWPANGGAEAMVRLRDGRFLIVSEGGPDGARFSDALLFDGDPASARTRTLRMRYRRPSGYRATDAALLPDGRLIVLNRRFGLFYGFAAALAIAVPGEPGLIEVRTIAELGAPLPTDNFEALAVTREGGRTLLWIASDDNFSPLQRTLLLKFALDLPPGS